MNSRRQGEKFPRAAKLGSVLDENRLPPQNLEAELGVLGAALLDPETIDDTAPFVRPEDFWRDSHQIVWKKILELRLAGVPVDSILLADALRRSGEYDRIGGDEFLADVLKLPHAANAVYHAQVVAQKAVVRRLIDMANETLSEGYAGQLTADELLTSAERRVFEVAETTHQRKVARHVKHDSAAVLESIVGRGNGEGPGLSTGFRALDFKLGGGLLPKHLVLIAGRASMGKTAFALNLVENVAVVQKRPVYFASLEMGSEELCGRLLSSIANVDGQLIRSGQSFTSETWKKLTDAHDRLSASPLWINDSATVTIETLASEARRQRRRNQVELIVVDYIGLMIEDSNGRNDPGRQEIVSKISRGLKVLAKDLNIPVIALAQLNRGLENRDDKRPRKSDLRDSGALEQDADEIFFMHRPHYFDINADAELAYCIIGKQRNGPTCDIELRWDAKTVKFSDWENPDNLSF